MGRLDAVDAKGRKADRIVLRNGINVELSCPVGFCAG
jgi:hypothetical protein